MCVMTNTIYRDCLVNVMWFSCGFSCGFPWFSSRFSMGKRIGSWQHAAKIPLMHNHVLWGCQDANYELVDEVIGDKGRWGLALDWLDDIKPDGSWWYDRFLVMVLELKYMLGLFGDALQLSQASINVTMSIRVIKLLRNLQITCNGFLHIKSLLRYLLTCKWYLQFKEYWEYTGLQACYLAESWMTLSGTQIPGHFLSLSIMMSVHLWVEEENLQSKMRWLYWLLLAV